MKRILSPIGNILAILVGLLGLEAPVITPAVLAIGLGGIYDLSLLQPLFIGLIIVAIFGQFYKARQSLYFMPLILEFVFGLLAFLFIFPINISIVGYLALLGILYILVWPFIRKQLQKKKVVKIKA
jgi:hypothetical protein